MHKQQGFLRSIEQEVASSTSLLISSYDKHTPGILFYSSNSIVSTKVNANCGNDVVALNQKSLRIHFLLPQCPPANGLFWWWWVGGRGVVDKTELHAGEAEETREHDNRE